MENLKIKGPDGNIYTLGTDKSLKQSGVAADSKVTGEKLENLEINKLSSDQLYDAVNDALKQAKENGEFDGASGKSGEDYVLTQSDKNEIAKLVEDVTLVQSPLYAESVDKMTDTSRVYVLASTGEIWAYMDTEVEKEVTITDKIIGTTDNPYQIGRLSSGGALSADVTGYVLTPYVNVLKDEYRGKTIQIHLEGCHYATTEASELYIMSALYDENKGVLISRGFTTEVHGGTFGDGEVTVNSDTSATVTFVVPKMYNTSEVGFIRFCGKGTENNSNVYITYTDIQTVSGGQWVNTHKTYAPALTEDEKKEIINEVAAMVDAQLLSVLGDGVVTV